MRRLADDDGPRAGGLRERRGQHGPPAEDRPVRPGIRRNVAAGQEPGTGDHGAGRALELVEVDVARLGDEDCVDRSAVVPVHEPHPRCLEVPVGGVGQERHDARAVREAIEVRLHGAERREQLLVADRKPRVSQLGRDRLRRHVAAVREQDVGPSGRSDPLEHLAGAWDEAHLRARPVDERPVDVEDEAADLVKTHGATPPGRRPSGRAA